jgi:hypothetical protein
MWGSEKLLIMVYTGISMIDLDVMMKCDAVQSKVKKVIFPITVVSFNFAVAFFGGDNIDGWFIRSRFANARQIKSNNLHIENTFECTSIRRRVMK